MNLLKSIIKIFKDYTSGFPFLLFVTGGVAVGTFIFIFRNHENFQFDKLAYIVIISAFWVVFSDIAKKRKIINQHLHFVFDSIVYLLLYSSIIYFTGGYEGGLFFLFFLATVSAPLFGTIIETFIFIIFLSATTFFIHSFDHLIKGEIIDNYGTGLILLQIVLYFIIAGVNKYFLERIKTDEQEKRVLIEKFAKECTEEVKIKTQGLKEAQEQLKNINIELEKRVVERTAELEELKNNLEKRVEERTKELGEKVKELERFQSLMVGREIKMIELKKEVEKLKAK